MAMPPPHHFSSVHCRLVVYYLHGQPCSFPQPPYGTSAAVPLSASKICCQYQILRDGYFVNHTPFALFFRHCVVHHCQYDLPTFRNDILSSSILFGTYHIHLLDLPISWSHSNIQSMVPSPIPSVSSCVFDTVSSITASTISQLFATIYHRLRMCLVLTYNLSHLYIIGTISSWVISLNPSQLTSLHSGTPCSFPHS